MEAERNALDAAKPPAPLAITDDIDTLIQAAAQDIEDAISPPSHPHALRPCKMVRGMIERITISCHVRGTIEVDVRGAFAGVMQAAGLVERHSLRTKLRTTKAPGLMGTRASLRLVAGARNHREMQSSVLNLALVLTSK